MWHNGFRREPIGVTVCCHDVSDFHPGVSLALPAVLSKIHKPEPVSISALATRGAGLEASCY